MAKLIEAKPLRYLLWRTGPYIYFYDGKCVYFNKVLVNIMNKMASNHLDLKVFVIYWKKKLDFYPCTPYEEMNTVYLFFD